MLLAYTILCIFVTIVKSPLIIDKFPIRTDYYESYTNPATCIELSHFYPLGPAYLYASFVYVHYSNLPNIDESWEHVKYTFKRLDKKCNSSLSFPSYGEYFKNLDIRITISISIKHFVAIFDDKFEKGFTTGFYELVDDH